MIKYSCYRVQSIYKFKESDSRFITFADKLYIGYNNYPWCNTGLSQSFRCTKPMTTFINECMIGYNRMNSSKESRYKPDYILCN